MQCLTVEEITAENCSAAARERTLLSEEQCPRKNVDVAKNIEAILKGNHEVAPMKSSQGMMWLKQM